MLPSWLLVSRRISRLCDEANNGWNYFQVVRLGTFYWRWMWPAMCINKSLRTGLLPSNYVSAAKRLTPEINLSKHKAERRLKCGCCTCWVSDTKSSSRPVACHARGDYAKVCARAPHRYSVCMCARVGVRACKCPEKGVNWCGWAREDERLVHIYTVLLMQLIENQPTHFTALP